MPSLPWLAVVPSFFICMGLTLGIVPVVGLYVSWAVVVPVLCMEDERAGLRRSVRLVRPRWWPVFGLLLASRVIASVASLIIGALLRLLGSFAGSAARRRSPSTRWLRRRAWTFVTLFLAATIGVLYLDLRGRKEGFDVVAQELGIAPAKEPRGRKKPGAATGRRRGGSGSNTSAKPAAWRAPKRGPRSES